jgi:hypothetical protein
MDVAALAVMANELEPSVEPVCVPINEPVNEPVFICAELLTIPIGILVMPV